MYYNGVFVAVFESKIRKVGTSLGVLIPSTVTKEERLEEGGTVTVSLIKPDFKAVERAFGLTKGKRLGPFGREHKDRAF